MAQRMGAKMQSFVNSPHVKEVIVVSRAGGSAADGENEVKRVGDFTSVTRQKG